MKHHGFPYGFAACVKSSQQEYSLERYKEKLICFLFTNLYKYFTKIYNQYFHAGKNNLIQVNL